MEMLIHKTKSLIIVEKPTHFKEAVNDQIVQEMLFKYMQVEIKANYDHASKMKESQSH